MIMHRDLLQFGLSEKEARVYLASLELGPATATQIAQKADVNRATTYVELEALMKIGLVSTFEKGKTTLFSAESPEVLKRILHNKEQATALGLLSLEKLLPDLLKMHEYAEERPRVRFFEGKEGLLTMQEDFLKTKDKAIEAVYNVDDYNRIFSEAEQKAYFQERVSKKIHARGIYNRSAGAFQYMPELTEARFIPESTFPLSSDIVIYGDKVAIASLRDKLVGVIIENKQITNTLRTLFNLAWNSIK